MRVGTILGLIPLKEARGNFNPSRELMFRAALSLRNFVWISDQFSAISDRNAPGVHRPALRVTEVQVQRGALRVTNLRS